MLDKLSTSRTAPAVQVRRAQLLKRLAQGCSASQAAALVGGVSAETTRRLLKRFNQEGLKVLEDQPRPGRTPLLTEQQRGKLVLLAKCPPAEVCEEAQEPALSLSKGACHWTLDTLFEAARRQQIPIGRTRLWQVLKEEGVSWWQRGRSWLESEDPEFPEKRGTSLASTPAHQREAQ